MLQEENIFFLDINNQYNDTNIEFNKYIDKDKFYLLPNKSNYSLSLNVNNYNLDKKENIFLEELNKVMNEPKIDLDEENSDEIYIIKKPKIELSSIDSSTKLSTLIENKDDNLKKKISFQTKLHHKRGRKLKKENNKLNKKCHTAEDFDNIQRKIQVSFISFLIRFGNDALKSIFGKKTKFNFKGVKYELKRIINHNYIENLKKCKYSDIIQMKISPKFKNFGENSNKETYIEVCKYSTKLKNFFDKNYLYIFQKYYCNIKNEKTIVDVDGMKIALSPKTKTLFNLLNKNEKNREKIKNVIKDVYFSEFNYINNNNNQKFVIFPLL